MGELRANMVERIVRYVDLDAAQADRLLIATTIENGRAVEPMRIESPAWLAVSCVSGTDLGVRFVLYFLSADGRVIDFAERESLDEALDEVSAVVQRSRWQRCSITRKGEGDRIPRESIA